MPRTKKKPAASCDPTERDYVMARLAAARSSAAAALTLIDQAMEHFVDPEGTDDEDGNERNTCFEGAAEALGAASRSVEDAQKIWETDDVDPEDGEDYGEEDGDDEEDEDDED